MRRHNRLYWRIWIAVLAGIALVAVLSMLAWKAFGERGFGPAGNVRAIAQVTLALLPSPDAPPDAHARALDEWSGKLGFDLVEFAPDGAPIAASANAIDLRIPARRADDNWFFTEHGPAYIVRLPDGRTVVARRRHYYPGPFGVVGTLALIALAVGLGAYPVARRLTRRLERLQAGVERLGGGDLKARVAVEGNDEVAALARSFNDAAARIEALMQSQRSLLANASHELRSPLARVRMAIEMLRTDGRPELKAELERNVAELDALIDEILLASRLDADAAAPALEEVDLTALAAEECARAGVPLDAAPATAIGDARLLRRLLRNLIENAQRHGGASPIDVRVAPADGFVEVDVCDRGPGVPPSERERIFEPFHRLPGASEAAGGVGLGLALVRKIAVQHRGTVECLPRDGGGSCFRVRLPAARAAH